MKRFALLLLLFWTVIGCGPKPTTRLYDEAAAEKITCLNLRITPPNPKWERFMQRLYPFDPSCKTMLEITTKCGIVCNSNQNAPRKNLSAFPDSYLRMEVSDGLHPIYSYYLDLQGEADEKELGRGWENIKKALHLKP
ncbi:MAG: hypothetical protein B6D59_05710 [Campylobacteraceae bacterium 4484_4]|nr:MAG: hypothetical protein B6D59_05710 [Campylobacteraceae bacterium 4484_4]